MLLVFGTLLTPSNSRQPDSRVPSLHSARSKSKSTSGNPFSSHGYVAWGCNRFSRGVALTFDDGYDSKRVCNLHGGEGG